MAKEFGSMFYRWLGASSEAQPESPEDARKMFKMVIMNIFFAGYMVLLTLLSRVNEIIQGSTSSGMTDTALAFCCFSYAAVVALFCALILNTLHHDDGEQRANWSWGGWLGSGLGFIAGLSFLLIYIWGLLFG